MDPVTVARLQELYPSPRARSLRKVIDRLDHHCRHFIALSPLGVLATATPDGQPDISPRGGDPGFAQVIDDNTMIVPDRPGNNRLDSLRKLAANPAVALWFLTPGIDETLRIYGRATIVPTTQLTEAMTADGKTKAGLRIAVEQAYFHCAKPLMRARLWDEQTRVDRGSFPTLGQILTEHTEADGPPESQGDMLRRYRDLL